MHQPQATEATCAAAEAADVGQHERVRITDDDVSDGALARDQNPDLASRVAGDLGKVARQFAGQDAVGRYSTPEGPIECAPLR